MVTDWLLTISQIIFLHWKEDIMSLFMCYCRQMISVCIYRPFSDKQEVHCWVDKKKMACSHVDILNDFLKIFKCITDDNNVEKNLVLRINWKFKGDWSSLFPNSDSLDFNICKISCWSKWSKENPMLPCSCFNYLPFVMVT